MRVDALWMCRKNVRKRKKRDMGIQERVYILESWDGSVIDGTIRESDRMETGQCMW